jgi:hypothetical protein
LFARFDHLFGCQLLGRLSQVPEPDLFIVTAGRQLVYIFKVDDAQNNVSHKPRRALSNVHNVLLLLKAVPITGLVAFNHLLLQVSLLLCEVIGEQFFEVPRKDSTVHAGAEQYGFPLNIGEALLGGWDVDLADDLVVLVDCVEEDYCAVGQAGRERVFVGAEFEGQDHGHALDVFYPLHVFAFVHADEAQVLFE